MGTTGEKIRELRKKQGLTLIQLGEKMGISGSLVGQYERGVVNPKPETISRFAAALGVPEYSLFPNSAYLERLAQAKEEVIGDLRAEEEIARDNGDIWDNWTYNDNREKKIYFVAPKYSVDALALSYEVPKRGESTVPEIQQISEIMQTMNETGRRVAVERVQELAQIPAYQTQTDPAKR